MTRPDHSGTTAEWPNGVPKISDAQRRANLGDLDMLRDLIGTLWLYVGHFEEAQLTTEQKELFADVVELVSSDDGIEIERWWRGVASDEEQR